MDEFLNIDWHPPIEDMIDNVFVNEQRMKDESVIYKILNGAFTNPLAELESDDGEEVEENSKSGSLDPKKLSDNQPNTPMKKPWVPGVVKAPFLFPRTSNLSKNQQAICLRVLLLFSGHEKPEMNQQSRNELELYTELLPTINEEQEEFLQLAKSHWTGSNLSITGKEYINARWKCKVANVRKLPRYYVAGANIPFKADEKIELTLRANLLEMGQLPRVLMPPTHKPYLLLCHMSKLKSRYPIGNNLPIDAQAGSTISNVSISQDPNCERFVEENEVDLVISSSGLNCLALNFGPVYTSSWILPVIVKATKRGTVVVYIDKPLPPTAMTVPQKNAWIYKYILRSHLLHPHHHTSISLTDESPKKESEDELFGNLHSDSLMELEEMDNESLKRTVRITEKSSTFSEEYSKNHTNGKTDQVLLEPKGEFEDFAINNRLLSHEKSPDLQVNDSEEEPMECVSFKDASLGANINRKTNDEKEKDHEAIKEAEDSTAQSSAETNFAPSVFPPAGSNVTYKIFSLGSAKDTSNEPLKTKIEEYKVLVRTRIDGIEKVGDDTWCPVMLVPKLEHQIALGAEAVSAEEAFKQWTTLAYRPNTSLLRVRISAKNAEFIQTERRSVISISNEIKRLYGLNPADSLGVLYNVVRGLKTLKSGNYLLRHTPSTGAFATIYQEAADSFRKNVFDLHSVYENKGFETIPNPPWPPIDKAVITPYHKCFERVPATFHSARTDTSSVLTPGIIRGRGGRGWRGQSKGATRGRGKKKNPPKAELQSKALSRGVGRTQRVRTKPKAKTKTPVTEQSGSEIKQS
ncbi:little elongation complex subunit 2-like isoform X2 [Athalia rosae]|uniref:little elongation complex subunit 2-like isoform X2 n=1 Tax=Athalia rosae TaxID=37344 RepID=UPI002033A339|nr:little elongation complex subunit 2-like isoform X2 [Athalia rosae]